MLWPETLVATTWLPTSLETLDHGTYLVKLSVARVAQVRVAL